VRVLSVFGPALIATSAFQLTSCETSNYAPPVTPQLTNQRTNASKLEHGRTLFVHRCIECHTLPPMWKYSREDWPQIVNDMAHRASLKPEERAAVIAYILAVRANDLSNTGLRAW
jgi:mono/diheme cytochrome c family protein